MCEVATTQEVDAVIARLGPDPLRADADPDRAWRRVVKSPRSIADLLMDQAVLALSLIHISRCLLTNGSPGGRHTVACLWSRW